MLEIFCAKCRELSLVCRMSRSSRIVSLEDVSSANAIDDSWVSDIGANGGPPSEDTDLLVTSWRYDGYSTCATGSPTDNRVPLCSCSRTRLLGVFLLIIAIITTAAFMTPLLFHYLYPAYHRKVLPPHNSSNSSTSINSCKQFSMFQCMNFFQASKLHFCCQGMESCIAYQSSVATSKECDAVPYDHRVHVHECTSVLSTWQMCTGAQSKQILVNFTTEQRKILKEFLRYRHLISSQCRNHALQFICQYTFHLCINHEETLVLPDKSQCFELRDKFCSVEWKFLQKERPQVLPNCDLLPGTYNTTNKTENVTCSAMFIEQNGSCVPGCLDFTGMDNTVLTFWKIGFPVLIVLGEIAALGVIATFIIKRNKMCEYPLLYVFYITVVWMILPLLILIGRFRPSLFCRHENLIENLNDNPSIFCIVTGIAMQWLSVSPPFMWLFLVSSILYKAVRHNPTPFELKLSKYIHIMLTFFGLITPAISVAATLLKEGRKGYRIVYYPPLFCVPSDSVVIYYTITLEINLLIGLGVNLCLLIFWLIYKYRSILKSHGDAYNKLSVAEMKLLLLYFCYVLFGIIILSFAEMARVGHYSHLFSEYFMQCGSIRNDVHDTDNCLQLLSVMQRDSINTLVIPLIVIMSGIPISSLVFVLNWKKVRNLLLYIPTHSRKRTKNLSVQE